MLTLLAHLTQSGRLRGKVIIVLKFYIKFFSLKPLDQLEPNLIGIFILLQNVFLVIRRA